MASEPISGEPMAGELTSGELTSGELTSGELTCGKLTSVIRDTSLGGKDYNGRKQGRAEDEIAQHALVSRFPAVLILSVTTLGDTF